MKSRTKSGAVRGSPRLRRSQPRAARCRRCRRSARRCRQDMHDQPKYAPLRASASSPTVERAAAGRGHGRARHAAGRRGVLHRQGRRRAGQGVAVPGRRRRCSTAARSATTSIARRATTRPAAATAWSCSAASSAPPSYPQRSAPQRRCRLLLRRDDQRFRRDAGLPRADHAARSLDHRRLHPRAAAESARAQADVGRARR